MHVTRLDDAKKYEALKHFKMSGLRLQGLDTSDVESFSCSLSYFLPGGGAERSCSPNEKIYIVIEGEITIITDDDERSLGYLDSCAIGVNEYRAVENRTNRICAMLVIISKNLER